MRSSLVVLLLFVVAASAVGAEYQSYHDEPARTSLRAYDTRDSRNSRDTLEDLDLVVIDAVFDYFLDADNADAADNAVETYTQVADGLYMGTIDGLDRALDSVKISSVVSIMSHYDALPVLAVMRKMDRAQISHLVIPSDENAMAGIDLLYAWWKEGAGLYVHENPDCECARKVVAALLSIDAGIEGIAGIASVEEAQ
jgi:hypothetical protein